jgi:hypothetical protein
VPRDALVSTVPTASSSSGGTRRTFAWVATGVAVAALGGGALFYTKASSSQSDLHNPPTGTFRSAAANADLVSQEKSNKTLSAVGLITGIAAGGAAAVLFAF